MNEIVKRFIELLNAEFPSLLGSFLGPLAMIIFFEVLFKLVSERLEKRSPIHHYTLKFFDKNNEKHSIDISETDTQEQVQRKVQRAMTHTA